MGLSARNRRRFARPVGLIAVAGIALLIALVAACVPVVGADQAQADSTPAPEATPTAGSPSPSPPPRPAPSPTPSPVRTLPPPLGHDFSLALELVTDGLSHPVFATSPPDDDRLFVVERRGRIRVVEQGRVRRAPFLDISDEVRSGNEQGLLGLAFHPDYARNRRLFVYYTAEPDGESRLEEHTANARRSRARPSSARRLLTVAQPHRWHNAGMIAFAPDGMLLVAFGDGGGQEAPEDQGQDPTTLLGTLVRIDVDGRDGDRNYAIPPDNPFADGAGGGAPEVWAYGLRNPWRFAIDPVTGLLYIADVGQYAREELNVVEYGEPGLNFGWSLLEGSRCVAGEDAACGSPELIGPVLEYGRDGTCAIIGGLPYSGSALPELHGTYFYGDYCAGWIRSLRMRDGEVTEQRDWSDRLPPIPELSSFATDASGELYVISLQGTIHRLAPGG